MLKFLFGILLVVHVSISHGQTASVAVATNMREAFTEIYLAFKATGRADLQVIYGSSGNLTMQILNGAPFKLLISADEFFPLELYKKGKAIDEGQVYAVGKLALISKNSSGIKLSDSAVDIKNAVMKANKIAIAKPDLAPYGAATVEYLKAAGLWSSAKTKLVYGDHIGAATMFVASGAADIGFTALSLAQSPQIAKETHHILLSEKLYDPIKQRMILIKGAPKEVVELYQFMQSSKAKDILTQYGYSTIR